MILFNSINVSRMFMVNHYNTYSYHNQYTNVFCLINTFPYDLPMGFKRLLMDAMREKGWNAYDLAKKSGVPQPTIHRIISGESADPRTSTIRKLAKGLGLAESALRESSHENVTNATMIDKSIPLISWVQAGEWSEIIDTFPPGSADEWQSTTSRVSKSSFALRVVGDSMINPSGFPSIPEGSIVIVDPEEPAISGKIVIAKLEDTNSATIKKLVIDGPNKYLMPLNPNYKPIEINGNCSIIGVVKQVISDL